MDNKVERNTFHGILDGCSKKVTENLRFPFRVENTIYLHRNVIDRQKKFILHFSKELLNYANPAERDQLLQADSNMTITSQLAKEQSFFKNTFCITKSYGFYMDVVIRIHPSEKLIGLLPLVLIYKDFKINKENMPAYEKNNGRLIAANPSEKDLNLIPCINRFFNHPIRDKRAALETEADERMVLWNKA